MHDYTQSARLSKVSDNWFMDFYHPLTRTAGGDGLLKVRRPLGTNNESEASLRAEQLNKLLADPAYWNPSARARAARTFSKEVVAAFYDNDLPKKRDTWSDRERLLPLPSRKDGYARVQLVGTTGAGKTTLVRQLLGTNPTAERFPSTSAAKTTICDIEVILGGEEYEAVVTFISREETRVLITECVSSAILAHLEGKPQGEGYRRFVEHADQKFRLKYILGPFSPQSGHDDEMADNGDNKAVESRGNDGTDPVILRVYWNRLEAIATECENRLLGMAKDLSIDPRNADTGDQVALYELVEEQLLDDERCESLVEDILSEIESRFAQVDTGEYENYGARWPALWTFKTSSRAQFLSSVNRFSGNYAGNFGKLLTPLAEGIRVRGPFSPDWHDGTAPRLVLMDGQGIGHTADSSSSISTAITGRFQMADAVVLVDNAAQPMQAAPLSVLRTVVASGHESKLVIAFTHFDRVQGDNLIDANDRREHVKASFSNASRALGTELGREAEHALDRLDPDRMVFLENLHAMLAQDARDTQKGLAKLLDFLSASIKPTEPIRCHPIYEETAFMAALPAATEEFHDDWNGKLRMGEALSASARHWTQIKALTRRIGLSMEEYLDLKPVADLILMLQKRVNAVLSEPLSWIPASADWVDEETRTQAIDLIRRAFNAKLHELSRRRLIQEQLSGWVEAHNFRGQGSAKRRAKAIVALYETAAPISDKMPGPDLVEFLSEVRELIAEAIEEGGGELRK